MPASNLHAIRVCRPAWNRGRIVGQKRPLLPKHVWAIRVQLELADRVRDLALFNLAIDSKLRGCDLVRLRVADVYAAGQVKEGSVPRDGVGTGVHLLLHSWCRSFTERRSWPHQGYRRTGLSVFPRACSGG